jgi:hypothetical protein
VEFGTGGVVEVDADHAEIIGEPRPGA